LSPPKPSRFRVAAEVHVQRFGTELVVLDLTGGEYYALDEIGARVWEDLAKGCPFADVVGSLAHEYQVDPDRLLTDLQAFTDELIARGLVLPLL
jgi:hypothetical protein